MIHRQRHIRVRYTCAVSDGDRQYSEAFKNFKTIAKRVAISYAFKVTPQRRMLFTVYIRDRNHIKQFENIHNSLVFFF